MKTFINEHRDAHGALPICRVLPIVPSTDYAHAARQTAPVERSARARSDAAMMVEIRRVFDENFGVYGVRTIWWQLGREGKHNLKVRSHSAAWDDADLEALIRHTI